MNLGSQPRARLATLPTPLHDAPRLREALGGERACPRILFKRDDLTGLALGGNKARKLEFLVGDALKRGATALVTTGAPQSNHARMTTAAARLSGLRPVLVLSGPDADPPVQGNLLLDRLMDAEVHLVQAPKDPTAANDAVAARVAEVMDALRAQGEQPYEVVLGGSDEIGTLGYVAMTQELVRQLAETGAAPSRLYHASGSRGTQAGLELGARLFNAPYRVHGIAVSGGEAEKVRQAARIANAAAERLGSDVRLDVPELLTDEGYFGEGYGIPTAACLDAIRLVARTETVFLDPVYTGKAMAGLIDHVRRGDVAADETVVFLHTGGTPGLFAQAERLAAAAAVATP